MGKKYIIEIEDGKEGIILCQKGIVTVGLHLENKSELKPLGIQSAIPYTEPDLEQVRKKAYQQGYEQGYKDGYNEPGKGKIQVGDEVRNIKGGWIAVVSNIDGERMTLMDTNGALGDGYDVNRFTKTGRHFPEIATVLKKMRGEQDG